MCDLANRLTDDSEVPMVRSEAFRQAHLVRRLLERLGQGAVTFRYRKADGSLRRARVHTGTVPVCSPRVHTR